MTFEGRAVAALLPRLLPLLDGTRTSAELAEELGVAIAPAIDKALSLLDANRLLVDGAAEAEVGRDVVTAAAFAARVTRRTTEGDAARAIGRASVAVMGSGPAASELRRQLRRLGVGTVTRAPLDGEPADDALVVAVPGAADVRALERLNRRELERGAAWLQVLPFDGRSLVVGPLFVPGHSACRRCYVLRRAACSGYEDDFDRVERAPLLAAAPPLLASLGAALAATIALRWVAALDPTLPGRCYALECGVVLRLSHQHVLRVPRCPACGEPERAVPSPWFDGAS